LQKAISDLLVCGILKRASECGKIEENIFSMKLKLKTLRRERSLLAEEMFLHPSLLVPQIARELIHTRVGSNTRHIPHRLKTARESSYLADKRPGFPTISEEDIMRVHLILRFLDIGKK
jgi:hypothetical protein